MEDEASFHRQPTAAKDWALRGPSQPRMCMGTGTNTCVRAAVALNPVSGQLIHRIQWRFAAEEIAQTYRSISLAYPQAERIFLVMDNWPVHVAKQAWTGIEADPRIRVLWLPTYSPWLNPAEKVWKFIRQRLAHMHPYAHNISELKTKLQITLQAAGAQPEELLRYTGTGKYKLYRS